MGLCVLCGELSVSKRQCKDTTSEMRCQALGEEKGGKSKHFHVLHKVWISLHGSASTLSRGGGAYSPYSVLGKKIFMQKPGNKSLELYIYNSNYFLCILGISFYTTEYWVHWVHQPRQYPKCRCGSWQMVCKILYKCKRKGEKLKKISLVCFKKVRFLLRFFFFLCYLCAIIFMAQ